jgi:hypothetical protein
MLPVVTPSVQPPGLLLLFPFLTLLSKLSDLPPLSCSPHCPLLPFLPRSLLLGLFQLGIHSFPSPLAFHMVIKQCVVSTLEGGSSSRSVVIFLYISKHVLILSTALMQPWITPSLFEETGNLAIVDERTFGLYQDPNVARAKLIEHWETWITESDIQAIAAAGCVLCAASFEFN